MDLLGELERMDYNVVNNLWLKEVGNDEVVIDPTEGPEDDYTITMRTLGVTFESINRNIASYPNQITMSTENNTEIIDKVYYLEDNQEIRMYTVIKNDGNLITTDLSGDTTLEYPIRKIVTIDNNLINSIYERIVP